jgi:hypothetical protein
MIFLLLETARTEACRAWNAGADGTRIKVAVNITDVDSVHV